MWPRTGNTVQILRPTQIKFIDWLENRGKPGQIYFIKIENRDRFISSRFAKLDLSRFVVL